MPRAITIINKPSMGQACSTLFDSIDRQCFRFKLVTTELKRSTLTNYRTGMIVATIIRPKLIDCGGLSSLAAHQSLLGRRPLNVK